MNWDQLKTILWLRWRLTRNQWARSGGIGAALSAVVAAVSLLFGVSTFGGALAIGIVMATSTPFAVMGIWLALTAAFIFIWLIGVVTELQRSETIDLQRLMHLPVRLGQIFVINYAASHLAMSVIILVPAMIGFSIGLAVSRGPAMLLMLPLSLGMVFMITAWTYCLRGWLATLMTNPRKRRAVVMGATAGFILLVQLPNLYFNIYLRMTRHTVVSPEETRAQRRARQDWTKEDIDRFMKAQVAVPPLWVAVGARNLAEGRAWPALLGTLGVLAIGGLGLRRAYRSTVRFYQGETGGAASARSPARASRSAARAATARARPALVERQLPRIPEQAAAVATSTLQSMLRAPEVKMQWGTSFLVTLLVGAPLLFRSGENLPEAAGPFIATGIVVFELFMMVASVANQFGFDRDGFRAYVLSPADRKLVLVGKNIASAPPAVLSTVILLLTVTVWLRVSPFVFLAALLQLVMGLLLAAILGNLLSILVPYRIRPGSMKPSKVPALAMLTIVASQMLFPVAMSPAFLPPALGWLSARAGGPPAVLVNLGLSLLLAAIMAVVYWRTIAPLGRLLHKRETRILEIVSAEVE
jgi:hypothetical protein